VSAGVVCLCVRVYVRVRVGCVCVRTRTCVRVEQYRHILTAMTTTSLLCIHSKHHICQMTIQCDDC
jgi:hypothetical protein